jgi:hypothetical protein
MGYRKRRTAVEKSRLRPSSRTAEADWIADQLAPFGSGVAAIVPNGFEAYVRVLHPAKGTNDEPIRWADVAAQSGRTMHRLAQFHAINRPSITAVDPAVNGPENGNLVPHLLKVLYTALSGYSAHRSHASSVFGKGTVGCGIQAKAAGSSSLQSDIPDRQSCPSNTRMKFLNSYAQQ